MPIKPIPIAGFKGMNNVREFALDLAAPKIILNSFVRPDGKIVKRPGYAKVLTLTSGHSLFAASKYMLFADGLTLYSTDGVSKLALGTVAIPQSGLFYIEVNNTVYISNMYGTRILDLSTNTLREWGLALPDQPNLTLTTGNLPPGRYLVCFTNMSGGRLSGNGPTAEIILTAEGGIAVGNIPAGGIIWMTEPNDTRLFYAGLTSPLVGLPAQTDILPSLWCQPPPFMENLCLGHGRIWGSNKEYLYYSMPFAYEWFRVASDFFYFPKEIMMVSTVTGGIYVGFEDETIFLSGKNPAEITIIKVGDGVVKGSLAYADNFGDYQNSTLSMLGNLDSAIPVWMSQAGIFAGMHNGNVIDLTSKRVKYDAGKRAASLFHMIGGEPQYMVSTQPGNVVGFGDSVTCEVIRNGRVFLGDYENGTRDFVGLAEVVSAEIL